MTGLKFEKLNKDLLNNLIGNKPVETYFTVDPKDEIFYKPLNEKCYVCQRGNNNMG